MLYDTLVIGAGQAGLAAGYYLQRAGLHFRILEAGHDTAGAWPYFYDSLTLNTPARFSALPGLPFPGDARHYPTRDEVIAYLRAYARHFHMPVMAGARVERVTRHVGGFQVETVDGRVMATRTLVAATGFFGRPNRPHLPGQEVYRGRVLHAAEYRRPEPYRNQRVVIVGGGNGAVQIGLELAAVAHVTLATRTPIRSLPQHLLGQDVHFWLRLTGLDRTQWLGERSTPVYLNPRQRAALRAGTPDRRPMFARLSERGVVWADGREEPVDSVLLATGYLPNLPFLAGLDALDEGGQPLQRGGVSRTVPDLYYVGLPRQSSASSATLRGVGSDAQRVVAALSRSIEHQPDMTDRHDEQLAAAMPW